jgi:hypothetical protein
MTGKSFVNASDGERKRRDGGDNSACSATAGLCFTLAVVQQTCFVPPVRESAPVMRAMIRRWAVFHDTKSIVVAFAITAVMLLMGMGFIAWGIEGMAAL